MAKKKIYADSIMGIGTLIVALAFIGMSLQLPGESKDGVPGAGYFPIFTAVFLSIFSVILIMQGIKKQNIYFEIEESKKKNLKQMIEVFCALLIFFVLWKFIPFIIAAIALEIALCRILKCSWKFTIIYSVVVVIILYLIFNTAFQVKLNIN